ncbi:rhomboid family intramembrane serine protease [Actinomadura sp. J1-007]|uniref:rhomboid family intramembrane serine protease n=1 Tax=Actinomadura sp. J1-007 TaxID=2661913 RepID=UPI002814DA96|nr:rhomboid family intramembrane serine protease [Actinomadura sp. J1-007]
MALPLYDSQPARRVPWVTYLLVAVNVVVFLLSPMAQVSGWYGEGRVRECKTDQYSYRYGAVPDELTSGEQRAMPPDVAGRCGDPTFRKTPWVSAFTSMFVHSGRCTCSATSSRCSSSGWAWRTGSADGATC